MLREAHPQGPATSLSLSTATQGVFDAGCAVPLACAGQPLGIAQPLKNCQKLPLDLRGMGVARWNLYVFFYSFLYAANILFTGIRTLFDRVTRGYGDHSPLTRPEEEVTHGGRCRRCGVCRWLGGGGSRGGSLRSQASVMIKELLRRSHATASRACL